jgi:hypothetical protein
MEAASACLCLPYYQSLLLAGISGMNSLLLSTALLGSTHVAGSEAEWIMERPWLNGALPAWPTTASCP